MAMIRAAVVQIGSLDLTRTIELVRMQTARCSSEGAQLVVFPEALMGKFDLDVAGHYSRPDIFRFSVNTS